jgi:hypothetical protein
LGQQQLLLIILAIIVVGIAIAISMQLFRENAVSNKRDLLLNECNTLGTMAISFYKKPREFGGGGNSFLGWIIPVDLRFTANGSYIIEESSQSSLVIIGTGTEVVTGIDSIQVKTTISKNSIDTEIIR